MHAGLAARAGVFAAELTAAGLRGAADALDGPIGFFAVFSGGAAQPERVLDGWGAPWQIASPGLYFKPWPCCTATHYAVHAALSLRDAHKLTPHDIERVTAVAASVPKSTVIFCDANAGWTPYQARQFADATRAIDYTFEQPCTTIDENMSVRRSLDKPMVLDESVQSLDDMLEIHRKGAADGLTLKISRLGGVTKTRLIRDVAVDLGFMITVEDTGGAEIDTAAMAHLSLSTPEERRLHAIAFHEWVTVRTASNMPPVTGSRMGIPDGPGLGIDVVPDLLGTPFFEIGR